MKITQTTAPVTELVGVSKVFQHNGRRTTAVRDVSFRAGLGELILLLGPSGSGKTTLLTLIAGLSQPTAGSVFLFGKGIDDYSAGALQRLRARRIGFVFQDFHLLDCLTALENVALVLRFAGSAKTAARRAAENLLSQLHVGNLARKFPTQLSQGEKQRVAVARAMANSADLIIADEPTANLETSQGLEIIKLLYDYAKTANKCVIVASHDLRIAEYADRTMRLEDGAVCPPRER